MTLVALQVSQPMPDVVAALQPWDIPLRKLRVL